MYLQTEKARLKLAQENKARAARRAGEQIQLKLNKKAEKEEEANDKEMRDDSDYNPEQDDEDSQDSVITDMVKHSRHVSKTTTLYFIDS